MISFRAEDGRRLGHDTAGDGHLSGPSVGFHSATPDDEAIRQRTHRQPAYDHHRRQLTLGATTTAEQNRRAPKATNGEE